jgi:phosphate transport system permease protein
VTDLATRSAVTWAGAGSVGNAIGATTVEPRPTDEAPAPRPLHAVSLRAAANVGGAAVASLSLTILLFGLIAPFSGLIGFVGVWYAVFVGIYMLLLSLENDRRAVLDKVITLFLLSSTILMCGVLVFIVVYTVWGGRRALFHANFYTQDLSRAGGLQPLTVGGMKHALVGTLWMIVIALSITVPLGLVTAIFMQEVGGPFARFVRTIVEAMTALPSIVAGLFIFATWILMFHQEKAALGAALALSVDMLPIIVRSADVVLRLVPGNLREASAALGAPQWRTVRHVVIPTARSGLATAVILGMARGLGETAPVLLTAGYTTAMNTSPTHGPMVSLPLFVYELVKTGQPTMIARGEAAAAFLLLLVLSLFLTARFIGGRGPGQLSRRQARRVSRRSIQDANRIIRSYDARSSANGSG